MILLCGIRSEPPMALVAERLREHGAHHVMFDQRDWRTARLTATVDSGRVAGTLELDGTAVPLPAIGAAYTRLMDDRRLPGVESDTDDAAACRALHAAVGEWLEVGPRLVLNRAQAQASNGSKPFQAQRCREVGFSIPDTLITNDPDLARAFIAEHRRAIYKSASGVRSIVREAGSEDLDRLHLIRWCPVQFQEWVAGDDVRVHVVGRETFATLVRSDGIDYRYAGRDGGSTELTAVDIGDRVRDACIDLADMLELPLAGIDLRIAPDGRVVCFEVNPSPGFSYYERQTDQPISDSIARLLIAADAA